MSGENTEYDHKHPPKEKREKSRPTLAAGLPIAEAR